MKLFSTSRPSPAMVVAVIALVFAMVGSAVAANDGLSSKITKSKVKKISKKQADKELKANVSGSHVNTADTASSASDSSKLGGTAAADYQQKADLLSATVAPAGVGPAIVRGRGATSVTRIATGFFRVTFNRDVSGCTWTASYGPPTHAFVDALWATVGGSGGPAPTPNQVGVVLRNDAGAQADGSGFHVLVLCP
jgi:hypothetical protein